MKVLLCHNYYQQRGGEDQSFEAEARLLESRGHDVWTYVVHNDAVSQRGRIGTAAAALWNRGSYREVRRLIRTTRPDVMHCTNTFPLLSPSVYYAAQAEGVPVVQSLRNYRLLCPNAFLLRQGAVCEDCVGRFVAWPGMLHGCYRGSRVASAVVAGTTAVHRLIGTWRKQVDLYFTPTEFARQRFVDAGFPTDRIAVKPNFVDPDPGVGDGDGGYAMYVGRLSDEKGVATLLQAWDRLQGGMPLKIVGDGPLACRVASAADRNRCLEWLGQRPHDEVLKLLGGAACLVMPSIWYETFGRTMIEAFARGTPVVASRLGCMEELVAHGVSGLHFEAGDAVGLAQAVERLRDDAALAGVLRAGARNAFESCYTGEINHRLLVGLYERVLSGRTVPPAVFAQTECERTVVVSGHRGPRAGRRTACACSATAARHRAEEVPR